MNIHFNISKAKDYCNSIIVNPSDLNEHYVNKDLIQIYTINVNQTGVVLKYEDIP